MLAFEISDVQKNLSRKTGIQCCYKTTYNSTNLVQTKESVKKQITTKILFSVIRTLFLISLSAPNSLCGFTSFNVSLNICGYTKDKGEPVHCRSKVVY